MDEGGARSNCCAIGVWAPWVFGPLKLKFGTRVPRNGSRNDSRNGSRTGRATLEPVASASPIGHPLSWDVPLVPDKGSKFSIVYGMLTKMASYQAKFVCNFEKFERLRRKEYR
jgi:hypothetical protein